jgi:hypothetical protein
MRKQTFYRCVRLSEKGNIVALKTYGYSDGDIGLHKDDGIWYATYIPNGGLLTPRKSRNNTAKAALAEAKRVISDRKNFEQDVRKFENSWIYKDFAKSKYEQSVTTVFGGS